MAVTCCKRCGNVDLTVDINPDSHMHYSKLSCPDCGTFVAWGKKPENEGKRYDKNESWKRLHRDEDGGYKCAWCWIDEIKLKIGGIANGSNNGVKKGIQQDAGTPW